MEGIKIAFFDIDGTLIDMKTKQMSPLMKETLIELKRNGIILCIATGRPFKSVPHFDGIDFDAFLTFNGSYCCSENTVLYKQPLAKEDVLQIIENTQKINRPVSIASADKMGANGTDRDLDDYFAISKQTVAIAEDFEALKNEDIYQIMLGCHEDEYDAILENVTGAKIAAWWERAADIIPSDSGKGTGIRKIIEHFNLKKENAIAFGDGANDIEMLEAVGLGVAMGNAAENVKKIADDVCDTVGNDGIYHYCKGLGLI